MARVTIALRDIKPNPYKRFVLSGRLDPAKIAKLEESVRQTEFWDNLYGRRNEKGQIELAYGHKRLAAARNVLGGSHETSIKVSALTDSQMIQAMATENATGEEESTEARIDVVMMAQKHLKEFVSPGSRNCPCGAPLGSTTKGGRPHEPGEEPCVAAFLGWSRPKVHELFSLHERLHPEIRPHIKERVGAASKGKQESGTLGQRTATILSSLAKSGDDAAGKSLQKQIFTVLKKAPRRATDEDVTRIVQAAREAPTARRSDEALTEARAVVEEIKVRALPSPKRDPKTPGRRQEELPTRIARMLPEMRRTDRACDEILDLLVTLGENVLLQRRYATDPIIGAFRSLTETLARKFEEMFKPQPSRISRRALNA